MAQQLKKTFFADSLIIANQSRRLTLSSTSLTKIVPSRQCNSKITHSMQQRHATAACSSNCVVGGHCKFEPGSILV